MEVFSSGDGRRDSRGSARRWFQLDGDIGRKVHMDMESLHRKGI